MNFTFDPRKAASNLQKHGVSFQEALTVFGDPFAQTLPDELHSGDEQRWVTIGVSSGERILSFHIWNPDTSSGSLAPGPPNRPNDMNMKNADLAPDIDDDLAPRNLDWSKAVRGKYYNNFQEGTNLAIIDPEIHEHFPDSESVNRALR